MKISLTFLLVAIFFPIFGRCFDVTNSLPGNILNYGIILSVLAAFFTLIKKPKLNLLTYHSKYILIFILGNFILFTLKLILGGFTYENIQFYRDNVAGFIYALSTLIIFLTLIDEKQYYENIKFFSNIFIVLFTLQIVLSFSESISGEYYTDFNEEVYVNYDKRDMLKAIGIDTSSIINLKIALTGLMSQHNYFGSFLATSNIFIISLYILKRSRIYALLISIIVLVALFNTTKTSVICIVICDIIFLIGFAVKKKLIKVFVITLSMIPFIIFGLYIIYSVYYGTSGDWSMFYRQKYWEYLIINYIEIIYTEPESTIIGVSNENLTKISTAYSSNSINRSFENEIISILFKTGISGLILYSMQIFSFTRFLIIWNKSSRYIFIMLLFTLFITLWTLDLQMRFYNLSLVVIIWTIAIKIQSSRQNIPKRK